jgi:hypothetical protein
MYFGETIPVTELEHLEPGCLGGASKNKRDIEGCIYDEKKCYLTKEFLFNRGPVHPQG